MFGLITLDGEGFFQRYGSFTGKEFVEFLKEAVWKKFDNPVFGPASNLAVVHEIILGGVPVIQLRRIMQMLRTHAWGVLRIYRYCLFVGMFL